MKISDEILTTITCSNFQYEYLTGPNIKKEIQEYADNFFFESFSLEFVLSDEKVQEYNNVIINENLLSALYNDTREEIMKYHKVSNIENIIGEVSGVPIQIGSIKNPMENIEIVGTMKFLSEKSFESKRKDKEGNSVIKTYYGFKA